MKFLSKSFYIYQDPLEMILSRLNHYTENAKAIVVKPVLIKQNFKFYWSLTYIVRFFKQDNSSSRLFNDVYGSIIYKLPLTNTIE